jgi:eukaryotic-like serine/threonine-protein kinase
MSADSPGPVSQSMLGGTATTVGVGPAAPDHRPEQIGSYRILELIGEGGMGEVYKAERRSPIRQTVALKVVKLGMNSREIVGRFESERQALALMDHPGIARVIDAGTTITGRPYFVMDFVAGHPITVFCDENRLSIPERLKLFVQVCDAIGHAHTKAIIHRDIKPTNVLAYLQDGSAAVKVIDFGIAKALTTDRLTDLTVNTAQGRAIGTYECMSPEQVEGSPDIDTRTDVYSLGVLLYEMLTGTKPFDHSTLSSSTDAEIRRIIREVEPQRPSTRLTLLGKDASALAERRQARLDVLARQLRNELEWIPLKAMRKERARRYASPAQLAEDIRNYLEGRPLLAGPESRGYRLKKYVGRHRSGLLTAAAVSTVLVSTVAYYVHSLQVAESKTKAALIESEGQRAEAQRQASIARESSDFLANIFRNADPNKSLGAPVTVVEALEKAVKSLDDGTARTGPLTEAMVRYVAGTTLRSLGRYNEALPNFERARELDAKYRSPSDPQTAVTLADFALLLMSQGKISEAEPLYREALRLDQQNFPAENLDIAHGLHNLASVVREQGKFEEAEQLTQRAIDIRRKLLPAGDPDIASALNNLGKIYWMQGKLAQAESIVRETLEMRKASLPAGHPNIAQSMMNLAVLMRDQGKFTEAEPLCREALQMRRAALPAEHPDIGVAADNLARILEPLGKLDEAAALFQETATIRKAALPAGDPRIADSLYRLANVRVAQSRLDEAESLFREALAIQKARDPKAAPTTQTVGKLADLLNRTNRPQEAADLRAEFRTEFGPTQPATRPATATAPAAMPTTQPARSAVP